MKFMICRKDTQDSDKKEAKGVEVDAEHRIQKTGLPRSTILDA